MVLCAISYIEVVASRVASQKTKIGKLRSIAKKICRARTHIAHLCITYKSCEVPEIVIAVIVYAILAIRRGLSGIQYICCVYANGRARGFPIVGMPRFHLYILYCVAQIWHFQVCSNFGYSVHTEIDALYVGLSILNFLQIIYKRTLYCT